MLQSIDNKIYNYIGWAWCYALLYRFESITRKGFGANLEQKMKFAPRNCYICTKKKNEYETEVFY